MSVPVVAHHQAAPVVQPAVAPLHLPSRLAGLMYLRGTARPTTAVGPFPAGDRGLNPPSAPLVTEFSTIIALVCSQAGWALLGSPLRAWHPHPVHHFHPDGNLSHVGRGHQEGHGQAVAFGEQVDRAALALPAIGYIISPFLAGTKLPSRNAWFQSSLPCWSKVLRTASQTCSHTPKSCHSCRRRWQVEGLPYRLGTSFQRAPERNTQRIPLRVRRSWARGRPRRRCCGRVGVITAHWSSGNSSSIAQAPIRNVGLKLKRSLKFRRRSQLNQI